MCHSHFLFSLMHEFTQKTLNSFNPMMHIKPLDITHKTDQNNLHVTVFMLPKTKCSDEPEDTDWLRQDRISDPECNLNNHLAVNTPPPNGPLFAYKHTKGHKPLTRKAFLDRLNEVATSLGIGPLKGHGLRIGGDTRISPLRSTLQCSKISWAMEQCSVHAISMEACGYNGTISSKFPNS